MIKTALAVIGALALVEWAAGRGRAADRAKVPLDQAFKHPFTSVADLRKQSTPAAPATPVPSTASRTAVVAPPAASSTMSVRTAPPPAPAASPSRDGGGNGGPYMRIL